MDYQFILAKATTNKATSEVFSIAEAIDKFGPYIVILAVVLLIFLCVIYSNNRMYNKFQSQLMKNNDDYKDSMTDLITKMVNQLLDANDKKQNEAKTNDQDLMNIFIKLRESMQDYCKNAMDIIHADRLAIYLFHNGTHSTHGVKFFKLSCICENVKIGSGVREHSIEHSNVPLNLFDSMVDELIKNGEYIIINNEELKNSNHRIFISSDKIKYAIAEAIFDKNNVILGFVLIESSKDYNEEIIKEQKQELSKLVYQISPVLIYGDYIDININKTNSTY